MVPVFQVLLMVFLPCATATEKLMLAQTEWPIVHGTPQNGDSLLGDLKVDTATKLELRRVLLSGGSIENALGRAQPVVVVKGPNDIWWTSGLRNVYALQAPPVTDGASPFEVLAEFERPQGVTTFHGSYSFVDSDGFFYAGFRSTVERFQLNRNEKTIVREMKEFSNLTTWLKDDKFVAFNISPDGFVIVCTFQGNVYVSDNGNRMGVGQFDTLGWRNLNLQGVMYNISGSYRACANKSGDNSLYVSNSIGMGAKQSSSYAFVPTAWGLLTVNVDAKMPQAGSFRGIDPFLAPTMGEGWFMTRLGPFGTGSSPTAFEVDGKSYVTVTDGQIEPMHLHVVETRGGLIVDPTATSIDVRFGESKYSTSEQSTSVMVLGNEAHLVVMNNYAGINSFDTADPNLWSVHQEYFPRILESANAYLETSQGQMKLSQGSAQKTFPLFAGSCTGGVNLYVFSAGALRLSWSNTDVCSLTGIPLQTKNRVWVVGTARPTTNQFGQTTVGPISLFGLDRLTGQVVVQAPLPSGDMGSSKPGGAIGEFVADVASKIPVVKRAYALKSYTLNTFNNIFYAGIETDGDTIVFGSVAGVERGVPV